MYESKRIPGSTEDNSSDRAILEEIKFLVKDLGLTQSTTKASVSYIDTPLMEQEIVDVEVNEPTLEEKNGSETMFTIIRPTETGDGVAIHSRDANGNVVTEVVAVEGEAARDNDDAGLKQMKAITEFLKEDNRLRDEVRRINMAADNKAADKAKDNKTVVEEPKREPLSDKEFGVRFVAFLTGGDIDNARKIYDDVEGVCQSVTALCTLATSNGRKPEPEYLVRGANAAQ